jgi:KDO2-lipid IV(A) lauroyltransferase
MSMQAPVRWVTHRLNGSVVVGGSYLGSRYVPLPLSWPIAHAAAWIVSHTMPSVRDALVDNLRAVFPHETDAQLRRRAYRTCHTYTDDWMDFMRSISWPREKVLERFSFERADLLRDALALGRGAILVTGHFGNWEAGAVLMKALQVPLTVVAMPEPDPNVNRIRHRVRRELDADTIEVRQSLDTALQIRRRLAEGRAVAMLMDRHVERDRVPVTMFGRRTHFMGAPALLAYLTGAPLVPIFLVREGRGRFRARPQAPIFVDRAGDRDEQVRHAAQCVATLLEREIAARPECWYQFYRYWEDPGTGNRQPATGHDGKVGPAVPLDSARGTPAGRSDVRPNADGSATPVRGTKAQGPRPKADEDAG